MKRMLIALVIPAVLGLGACKKKEEAGAASGTAAATGSAAATGAATGSAAATGAATGSAAATGTEAATGSAAPTAAAGERPAVVTDEMVALADKMVGQMEQMGKDLTAAGEDCTKGADALKSNMGKLKPIAEEAKKHEASMKDPAAEEWFKKTYMPRLMGAMGGMMTLAQKCQNDAGFAAAMKEMDALDM
jgi:hypothetical protein